MKIVVIGGTGLIGSKTVAMGGEQHARYATKSHGAIAAKHRVSEGELQLGALPLNGRQRI